MGFEEEIFDKLQLSLGSKNWACSTYRHIHRAPPSCRHLPFFIETSLGRSKVGRKLFFWLQSVLKMSQCFLKLGWLSLNTRPRLPLKLSSSKSFKGQWGYFYSAEKPPLITFLIASLGRLSCTPLLLKIRESRSQSWNKLTDVGSTGHISSLAFLSSGNTN